MLPTDEAGVPLAGTPSDQGDALSNAFTAGGLSAAYSMLKNGEEMSGDQDEETGGNEGGGGGESKGFDDESRHDAKTRNHWQSLIPSGMHSGPIQGERVALLPCLAPTKVPPLLP